jgi:DNA-binding NarL/FixJ family response regulator
MSAHILEIFSGGKPARKRSSIQQLSDREFEVFELIGEGLRSRDRREASFEHENGGCSPSKR